MELVISMGVLMLLSAAVFGIISGVLKSATVLQDNQNRRDQLMALNAYLNQKLKGMPAKGVVISYQRGNGDGLNQNGIIFGWDSSFTAIDAVPQSNGYYTIRLTSLDPSTIPQNGAQPLNFFQTAVMQNDTTLRWSTLIRDVRQLDWKFQVLNATDWLEMWNDPTNKPNLIELSLQQAGDAQPSIMDFWIQKINPVNLAVKPQGGGQ